MLLPSLNHQEPDRVPIDIGGLVSFTCWHEEAEKAVANHLRIVLNEQYVNSFFSRTVRPVPEIRERFKTDFFGLASKSGSTWTFEEVQEEYGGSWLYDEWGIKWRKPEGGHYYDAVEHPLFDATLEDVVKYKWPDPDDPARLSGVVEFAKELFENTDYCICYSPVWSTGVFQVSGLLQGWENHYVNILINKKVSSCYF